MILLPSCAKSAAADAVEGSALKIGLAITKRLSPERSEGPAVAFSWFGVQHLVMPDCGFISTTLD
jgi:hypothetical protein